MNWDRRGRKNPEESAEEAGYGMGGNGEGQLEKRGSEEESRMGDPKTTYSLATIREAVN